MQEASKKFYTIGIGTSADSLELIQQFFDHIPYHHMAAFVIVQNLLPDFDGRMSELLSRYTLMGITTARDRQVLAPGNIYLIPSKKSSEVKNGRLLLSDKELKEGHCPIDFFFHSLGKEFRERAIGIIMSGSGTDGLKGLDTLHKEGGYTMIQEPESARFDAMPDVAYATDFSDFTGTPPELARQLTAILPLETEVRDSDEQKAIFNKIVFNKILNHIHSLKGIEFGRYKTPTIKRRMHRRMITLGIVSISEYYDFLLTDEDEAELLSQEFMIGVTGFFRNAEAFEVLKKKVFPSLFSAVEEGATLRVWVTGCSTGEEAYSLAILLLDYEKKNKLHNSFKIFATDIDKRALAKAALGTFDNSIEKDIKASILSRYFTKSDDRYTVIKEIRDRIVFACHDILNSPPFVNIDLVCCRNLLIYIDTQAQAKIIEKFYYILNRRGVLFLGASESIYHHMEDFEVIDNQWKIFGVRDIKHKKPYSDFGLSHWQNTFGYNNPIKSKVGLSHSPTYTAVPLPDYKEMIVEHCAPQCLITNKELEVFYIRGDLREVLHFPKSVNDFNLKDIIGEREMGIFVKGIDEVLKNNSVVEYRGVPFRKRGKGFKLDIRFNAKWLDERDEKVVLIEFMSNKAIEQKAVSEYFTKEKYSGKKIQGLEISLKETRAKLKSAIENYEVTNEELQTANEELMSFNEEMQNTNEELLSVNEELQSVNEELCMVNNELEAKIVEVTELNNDMDNLLSSTDIGTIFLDEELRLRKFTPAIQRQIKLVQGDIGRPIFHFDNQFGFENFKQKIAMVLHDKKPVQSEVCIENGRSYLMKINPFLSEKPDAKGIVVSFVDIQQLKDAELSLRISESKLEAIVTSLDDIIFEVDPRFTLLNIWTSDEDRLPIPRSQMLHSKIADIYSDGAAKKMEEAIAKVFSYGIMEETTCWEFRARKWYRVRISPLFQLSDEEQRVSVLLKDITKEKRDEKSLKESLVKLRSTNQYLDSFVHTAAHDLRSPIINLKNLYAFFVDENDEVMKTMLMGKMSTSLDQLEDTVDSLIQIIDTQKNDDITCEKLYFNDVCSVIIDQLQYSIKESGAIISTDFDCEEICYNKAYLSSILQNLISNAVKYRRDDIDCRISLSTKKEEEGVLLTVTDNGIGIDLKKYGHLLFKPFKRLTTVREGKGIGLNIVKNMVEKNGGTIEIKSSPQEGAKFDVHLKPY